jgi:hypothetical protein
MQTDLHSLAYFSRNAIPGDPEQMQLGIADILASARKNNVKSGVTGALLFSDGCFAQVLEGPRETIEGIFETIQCDARHCDVAIMHLHPIEARSFGNWSMAFGGIEGVSVNPQLGADDILALEAGRSLLAALKSIVLRDDMARNEVARVAACN